MNTEDDWRREAHDARAERNASRCQCSGEMPGQCPGPASCPMCQSDDAETE